MQSEKIKIFRENLKYNGFEEIDGKLSDEELDLLINIAAIPAAMSVTAVKKTLFTYIFLNKDNAEIEKTIDFFKNQLDIKKNLPISEKRMIIFFIKNKMHKNTRRAYLFFLKTYGVRSSTYQAKFKNPFDFINFTRVYNETLRPLISSLKKPTIKKFNGLKTGN